MSSAPLEVRFLPITEIVRRRILPVPGEVLVRMGDRVRADDVVAQALLEGQLSAIDLAGALGLSVRSIERHLLVSEGQKVVTGTPLARTRRFWVRQKQVEAPFAGTVQAIIEGRLFLRQEPQWLLLRAYVPGEVTECYPHRGAVIRSVGSLVRGIWGSGGEQRGMLVTPVNQPGKVLTWEHVGLRYRGAILVGGVLDDARVLMRAKSFGLRGLVIGSMLPGLRPLCARLSMPVVVTEGMGRIPMAAPIFDLLRSYDGRPAIIAGAERAEQGPYEYGGPEVIVPLPTSARATSLAVVRPIRVGVRVRITRFPYLGAIGQVSSLLSGSQQTPIGTRVDGAEVRLPNGHKVFVPYVNMELIG